MKAWLVYWILGCALVGFAQGGYWSRCPNDEISTFEVLAMVSIWPTAIFGALALTGPLPKTQCKRSEILLTKGQ